MYEINIAIVEHNALYRSALRTFLAFTAPDIRIVSEGVQISDALASLECASVDILVLAVDVAWQNGKNVLALRQQLKSPVQIVILSAYAEPDLEQQLLADGAAACLVKYDVPQLLIPTLQEISKGRFTEAQDTTLDEIRVAA